VSHARAMSPRLVARGLITGLLLAFGTALLIVHGRWCKQPMPRASRRV